MPDYRDVWYHSSDGLRLYARDYPASAADAPVVLCMHGLTRNSADFAGLAAHLAGAVRVLVVDQRGRGRSDYDPNPDNYQPVVYLQDMFCLLDTLDIERVSIIGTSMGGLIGMLMASTQPGRIGALVLNDIGPEVNPEGLARIQSYVGRSEPVSSWEEAEAQARATNADAFPDFSQAQWRQFTRALYREVDGVPELAYDPQIAAPLAQPGSAVPPDLWPLFESLQQPVLVLRGELSDILSPDCARRMLERGRACELSEVPRRGHAPTLDETPAREVIDGFLARVT